MRLKWYPLPGVHNLFAAAECIAFIFMNYGCQWGQDPIFFALLVFCFHTLSLWASTHLSDGDAPMYPQAVNKIVLINAIYLITFQLMHIIIFWIICARPTSVYPRPNAVVWPQVLHFCPRGMTGLNEVLRMLSQFFKSAFIEISGWCKYNNKTTKPISEKYLLFCEN